ncbi:MAG: histidine phosphatase family protein [Bacteroidota bacterium]
MPATHGDILTLTVVRHAEATSISHGINSDSERPVTGRGMADALAVGRMIALLDHVPQLVITSPLLRAVQTGAAIAGSISQALTSSVSPILAPGFEPPALLEELLALRRTGIQSILAVAHQPDVGKFITHLIAGRGTTSLGLGPGTAARLSVRFSGVRPDGILQWFIPPETARALLSFHQTSPAKS